MAAGRRINVPSLRFSLFALQPPHCPLVSQFLRALLAHESVDMVFRRTLVFFFVAFAFYGVCQFSFVYDSAIAAKLANCFDTEVHCSSRAKPAQSTTDPSLQHALQSAPDTRDTLLAMSMCTFNVAKAAVENVAMHACTVSWSSSAKENAANKGRIGRQVPWPRAGRRIEDRRHSRAGDEFLCRCACSLRRQHEWSAWSMAVGSSLRRGQRCESIAEKLTLTNDA